MGTPSVPCVLAAVAIWAALGTSAAVGPLRCRRPSVSAVAEALPPELARSRFNSSLEVSADTLGEAAIGAVTSGSSLYSEAPSDGGALLLAGRCSSGEE